MKIENKVFRVTLNGGIIGALSSNPKLRLEKKIDELNSQGYRVVQVINDSTGNILVYLWRIILLVITIFLYTKANGYFVVAEKESK